jgi:hypothetical protein
MQPVALIYSARRKSYFAFVVVFVFVRTLVADLDCYRHRSRLQALFLCHLWIRFKKTSQLIGLDGWNAFNNRYVFICDLYTFSPVAALTLKARTKNLRTRILITLMTGLRL